MGNQPLEWGTTYGDPILGWRNIHFATNVDVHQGYRVLTHSQINDCYFNGGRPTPRWPPEAFRLLDAPISDARFPSLGRLKSLQSRFAHPNSPNICPQPIGCVSLAECAEENERNWLKNALQCELNQLKQLESANSFLSNAAADQEEQLREHSRKMKDDLTNGFRLFLLSFIFLFLRGTPCSWVLKRDHKEDNLFFRCCFLLGGGGRRHTQMTHPSARSPLSGAQANTKSTCPQLGGISQTPPPQPQFGLQAPGASP